MNILHLIPALESGGVETGTIDLALALAKLGQNIFVISAGGRLVKVLEDKNILHITLPINKKSPLLLLLIPRVAYIIKKHKIDIVHASSRSPAWAGFFASKLTSTPFVTSCHGFYSKHFFSRVMGWGKLVIVISETIGKRMTEDFGVAKEKIRLVYRGVDLSKYRYDPDKYNRVKDSFIVLNIGRLTPLKGHYEFIKAVKLVKDKIRMEARIVGGPEKGKEYYADKLKNLVKKEGLEDSVKFLGIRDDVQSFLREADLLVLSTNVPEGFGRTVIEAGASGTACCASGTGGIKEIIDDGVSGLLFPPKDIEKMASAITRMLSDVSLRKSCAKNLREKVEKLFTLEKMAEKTLSVYKEVAANRCVS